VELITRTTSLCVKRVTQCYAFLQSSIIAV
jgi:hypothetical protein